MSVYSTQLQKPHEEPPTMHTTRIILDETQPFPSFLENSWTMLESLSMDAVEFVPGQFGSLLASRRLMAGLQNLVVLNISNIPNFPAIVLSSCVQLQELVFRNVQIGHDASLTWSLPGPHRLKALTCSRVLEQTYQELVSIVDVTHLLYFDCEIVDRTPDIIGYGPKGPQYVLDRCGRKLERLVLRSEYSFQPLTKNHRAYLCDLSELVMLRCLVFITSVKDVDCDWPLRPLIVAQVLATISQQTRTLESLQYITEVCIDEAPKRKPGVWMLLATPILKIYFQNNGWHALDRAVARVASGRMMDFYVGVRAWTGKEKPQMHAPVHGRDDSCALDILMKKWGEQTFVAVREQHQIDFAAGAQIVDDPWLN
ncbi:hypothetical protein HYPSUDRAFT_207146 [Hypholoma sublateritium FD-334 SS-4]|uniref:F-box domain-containing protein n=1 Tax=Hypholoma sublateritium (strain FD-334 SS-4) TaxID=945553 RepID=A0A0D2NB01_HYPSF|nr:hypothetical protein HYPSUDRAFT_207146 [Hypholoma sublateritium FD-334 SS-4]